MIVEIEVNVSDWAMGNDWSMTVWGTKGPAAIRNLDGSESSSWPTLGGRGKGTGPNNVAVPLPKAPVVAKEDLGYTPAGALPGYSNFVKWAKSYDTGAAPGRCNVVIRERAVPGTRPQQFNTVGKNTCSNPAVVTAKMSIKDWDKASMFKTYDSSGQVIKNGGKKTCFDSGANRTCSFELGKDDDTTGWLNAPGAWGVISSSTRWA